MQTSWDGSTYTKGNVCDTFAEFNIVCADLPFKLYPEAKEVVTKDWVGEDGVEVYVPSQLRIKDYDIEATFLYVGDDRSAMREEIDEFLRYLQGRITTVDNAPIGARLAISEEYTQTGRKDVVFVGVDFDTWWAWPEEDTEFIARFKVKFHVYDPVTNVGQVKTGDVVTDLTWT